MLKNCAISVALRGCKKVIATRSRLVARLSYLLQKKKFFFSLVFAVLKNEVANLTGK